MPHVRAGASYLLGEFDDAVQLGGDGVEAGLAEVARSGTTAALPLVRGKLVDIALAFTNGPSDAVGDPLTTWDWLEESFLLESRLIGVPVPSHLEMLERLGVLTDEPEPPVPPALSPPVGLRVDLASGAVPKPAESAGPPPETQYPTIEFNDGDVIDIELADDLILQFRTPLEAPQWYGRIAFEQLALMDDVVPPPHPTWQDAAREMIAWLKEHQNGRGVSELERLICEHP